MTAIASGARNRLLTNLLAFALTAGLGISVARALQPQGKAVFELVLGCTILGATLLGLGLETGAVYLVSSRRASPSAILRRGLTYLVPMSALVIVAAFLLPPGVQARLLGTKAAWCAPLAALALVGYASMSFFVGLLRGLERLEECNLALLAWRATPLALFTLAQLVGRASELAAVAGLAAGAWIAALWAFSRLLKTTGNDPARAETLSLPELVRPGALMQLALLLQAVSYRLGLWLAAGWFSLAASGYFSVGLQVALVLRFVPDSLVFILLPRLSAVSLESASNLAARACRVTFLLSLLSASLLVPCAGPLVRLVFGESFAKAVPVVYWLLPGMVAAGHWKVLGNFLLARGKAGLVLAAAGSGLALNALASLLLAPHLGLAGLAAAASLGNCTGALVCYLAYRRLSVSTGETAVICPSRQDLRCLLQALPSARCNN